MINKYSNNFLRVLFLFLGLVFISSLTVRAEIVINEFLASTEIEDASGTSLEWIELYNSGSKAINLSGYALTDDFLAPDKWTFGTARILPGGYLRVWATGYGLLEPGNFHTNFKLRRRGEYLGLVDPGGNEIDSLIFPEQYRDISYGRKTDGGPEWRFFPSPTPEAANASTSVLGFLSAPVFSVPAGIYQKAFQVTLSSTESNTQIRYTLNGSPPNETSPPYETPIDISETTIVRASAFRDGYLTSRVITHSYIFREEMSLPILSIVTDHDNLWGRTKGIYTHAEQHGMEWERPCSVEFFTLDGKRGFAVDTGIRIHGGASRGRSPKKSFRFYFRSEYGAGRLEYPLFPSTSVKRYNQIVLRAGFNDSWGYDKDMQRDTASYISDQVARDLHLDMGQPVAHGIFTELYLNGEYWGLYNPTERIEDDNLAEHSGIDAWTIVADGELHDGDLRLWRDFSRWVSRTDFSTADGFEEFQTVVDIDNFTSYILLNIWLMNYDWPHHNWYIAHENTPDGKWKFFLWDAEYAFGSGIQGYRVDQNTFQTVNDAGKSPIGTLFNKIIKNTQYRHYFWTILNESLDSVLSQDHVLERLEHQADTVRAAIPAEAEKWGRGKTPDDWEHALELARDFVRVRTPIVLKHVTQAIGPAPVPIHHWELY